MGYLTEKGERYFRNYFGESFDSALNIYIESIDLLSDSFINDNLHNGGAFDANSDEVELIADELYNMGYDVYDNFYSKLFDACEA